MACEDLYKIVENGNIYWDLRKQALKKLGDNSCTAQLRRVAENGNIHYDLRKYAIDLLG